MRGGGAVLIDSDRLTDTDRRMWEEWLQADIIRARSAAHERNVEKTKDIVRAFCEKGKPYYVGLSWGKDSVTLAHLMVQCGADPLFVYIRNLAREPEGNAAVRDAFLKRYPIQYEERAYDYSAADDTYFDRNGKPCKWQHILAELKREYGCHVTGIRYDESAKRRRRFRFYGTETEYSFAPFRYMTVYDIFAYLWKHDLPVHPNYAMTGGGRWDKYKIRVAAVGNREGDGMGRTEWEREYYGDVLNRMGGVKCPTKSPTSA
jgi:phosphoadenosine phosphosulfate reductase